VNDVDELFADKVAEAHRFLWLSRSVSLCIRAAAPRFD
jgi:hypothetical protein